MIARYAIGAAKRAAVMVGFVGGAHLLTGMPVDAILVGFLCGVVAEAMWPFLKHDTD